MKQWEPRGQVLQKEAPALVNLLSSEKKIFHTRKRSGESRSSL